MPTTDEPNNDDGLTLLDQKRALEDEIWLLAIAENYPRGRLKGVLSREEVIANGHLEKYPFRAACKSDSKNLFEFDTGSGCDGAIGFL